MMLTTYKHDFIPPHRKRYDFVKRTTSADDCKVECQSVNENTLHTPKIIKKCTEIAPVGHLTDPRIIPTKFSLDQLNNVSNEIQSSFKEQPNRFLKTLHTVYPDLYERLKLMSNDELNRRLECDRMYTTYQIDFCGVNEYPKRISIYSMPHQAEDETSKLNASKLLQRKEACTELKKNVIRDICEKSYKPFKISFDDSFAFINSGNSSHWRSNVFTKKAKFTEYMDTINKMGCVIMKNNIHSHQKCTEKNCRHQLTHGCVNLR